MEAKAAIDAVFINDMASTLRWLQPQPPTSTHRIRLTKTKAYRQAVEGLSKAKEIVGDGAVKLDDDSDPPAIVVYGDTVMLRKVQNNLLLDMRPGSDGVKCDLCLDDFGKGELAKMPTCGHACCHDCFRGYCNVDRDSKYPMRCFQTDCDALLPVQLLRTRLSDSDFNVIMQQAIKAHFDRHPGSYAPCSGPNCTAYYKLDGRDGDVITCPTCFTITCTKCADEEHAGETCAEYQERITGRLEAFEEWMRAGNAKKCKNCNRVIQKIGGCDHMQCPKCEVHFCFSCMEIFPDANAVYEHMYEAHGNHGDPEALELQAEVERGHQEGERLNVADAARMWDVDGDAEPVRAVPRFVPMALPAGVLNHPFIVERRP